MQQGSVTGILRGDDSTGIFNVSKKSSLFDSYKCTYAGNVFPTLKPAQRFFNKADEPGAAILHHRAATRGSISTENAHPFHHEIDGKNIIGVHNGTINSAWANYDGKKFDVDSDYLIYRMLKEGPNKALGAINGAVATVWYGPDAKMRIFTNGERSIFFAFVKDKNAMMIASEAGMLYWLATRNGIAIEGPLIAPDKGVIHTFDINGELRNFEREQVEVAPPTNFHQTYNQSARSTTSTTTTHRGQLSAGHKAFLDYLGVGVGDKVDFYPDSDDINPASSRLTGYVELDRDFVPCIMYGATPLQVISINRAKYVQCSILGATALLGQDNAMYDAIVVSVPTAVVMEDPIAFPDIPENSNAEMVPGPGGKPIAIEAFLRRTASGCISCQCSVTPKAAREGKLLWVNNDHDVLCESCAEDFNKHTGTN